jgi:CheY-like chemotaxis protein
MTAAPTLLVVDDEPANLDIVAEHLDGEGYELVTAVDGQQALEIVEQAPGRFDALLLDHMMPELDGMSLLKLLKSDERHRLMPVIMQTAATAPEQVARGLELGAYYYLTKPYDGRALRAVVRTALWGRTELRDLAARVAACGGAMPLVESGHFRFRTLAEARHLGVLLASACPQPECAAMGLTELMINAVEHGNLGIGYAEKARLKLDERVEEEAARRLALPQYAGKSAEVRVERLPGRLRFIVADQGAGFDFRRYLVLDPVRAFDLNGRGIALARMLSFATLEYLGAGNEVVATVALP